MDDGTTYEAYVYDGRLLLVSATDDDSEVVRTHDSLGAILTETQTYSPIISLTPTPYTVSYERDGVGNATLTSYPSGRVIEREFDGLRRTKQIEEDSAALVELDYLGPSLLRRTYVEVDTQSDFGYDLARRMISSEHAEIGGPTFDEREYGFDPSCNKQSEEDLSPNTPTGLRVMTHDSLGRMIESDVSGSDSTDRTVEYEFDEAGNRTSVSGDACAGTYDLTGNDALLNQYTETSCEEWTHDAAGNLVESEAVAAPGLDRWLSYDHRGRLVAAVTDPLTVDEVAYMFAYDALGRKIHTTRIDFNTIEGELYIYDDGNVIEEYPDEEEEPSATYLYGDGLDERLQMIRGESWWYYDDELGSTSAVGYRDIGTLVLERYAYQDYGEPVVLASEASGNPYLFAGSRWFGDASLYDMRTRHFDPFAGRFISRDSIGIWGDEENLGNEYVYVSNAPDTYTDPTGETKKPSISNCPVGGRDKIEEALDAASHMVGKADQWLGSASGNKNKKERKAVWNAYGGKGLLWWGKYSDTRHTRIKKNTRKMYERTIYHVIKFKCLKTGSTCESGDYYGWTKRSTHATIRLCRSDPGGYFRCTGSQRGDRWSAGKKILHEISHNIGTKDKKLGGKVAYGDGANQRLAAKKPGRASRNADNYANFAEDFAP